MSVRRKLVALILALSAVSLRAEAHGHLCFLAFTANGKTPTVVAQSGGLVALRDNAVIEGSVDHGGVQPHYIVDAQNPRMRNFLKGAREIGQSPLEFWEKVRQVSSYSRQFTQHWEYNDPVYLSLIQSYRERGASIPLSAYLEKQCGVCREQAMLLNLALQASGLDSHYLYVHVFLKDNSYLEDHAINIVRYEGIDWIIDSRRSEYTGRRLVDVLKPGGIRTDDPVSPMSLPPPQLDVIGDRFEIAPYPLYYVP